MDADGREWRVLDYSVIAGNIIRNKLGAGQYRGFQPVDGGARRTFLMFDAERAQGTTLEVLRAQLAASKLYTRDDPDRCAAFGHTPERVDPSQDSRTRAGPN